MPILQLNLHQQLLFISNSRRKRRNCFLLFKLRLRQSLSLLQRGCRIAPPLETPSVTLILLYSLQILLLK